MADADTRYRSLTAAGTGSAAGVELVVRALEPLAGLVVREVAPGRIGVARTRRPRWALLACVATFWLGGLGFLFLLVKQTEAGEITVTDAPQGCVVVLPPLLAGAPAEAVEAALRGPDPSAGGPVPSFGGRSGGSDDDEPADDLDTRTVTRQEPTAPPLPPPPPPPTRSPAPIPGPTAPTVEPARARLRFDGGTVTVVSGEGVVLGRDPSGTGSARPEVVPGEASSVSKSHLLVVAAGAVVTAEDLGSTNGSALLRDDRPLPLEPGEPVELADGDLLVLGAVSCTVELVPPGSEPTTTAGSVA